MLRLELLLCDTGAVDACRAGAGRNYVAHFVYDFASAPFLMCQCFHAVLPLLALDCLDVCSHASLCVIHREIVDTQCIAVEACECDELPTEAKLGEVPKQIKDWKLRLKIEKLLFLIYFQKN